MTAKERPFARLGVGALLLLLVAAALLAAATLQPLRAQLRLEADTRALLVTEALAQRVQRAVSLGIPLDNLPGLEELFEDRMAQFDDIAALALRSADGRTLAIRTRGHGVELPPGSRALAAVRQGEHEVAQLVLVRSEPQMLPLVLRWVAPLLSLVLLWAMLAEEALRYALAGAPRLRDALVDAACARLAQGDFGWRMPLLARHDYDLRPQWLAAQMRQAQERHLRIRRLVQSLQVTEADPERRLALERALADASGTDRFTPGDQLQTMPLPSRGGSRWRWTGLWWGLGAWLPAGLVLAFAEDAPVGWIGWPWWALVVGSWALAALALAAWGRRRPWRPRNPEHWYPLATGFARGVLFAGPGLFLFLVEWLHPEVPWTRGWPGVAVAAWVAAGCLVSLLAPEWTGPRRLAERRGWLPPRAEAGPPPTGSAGAA